MYLSSKTVIVVALAVVLLSTAAHARQGQKPKESAPASAQTKTSPDERRFKLTEQSLKNLKSEGLPADVLKKLEGIKNRAFKGQEKFLEILRKTIGAEQTAQFESLILKNAQKIYPPGVVPGHTEVPQPNIARAGTGLTTRGFKNESSDPAGSPLQLGITLLLSPASPTVRGLGLSPEASQAPAIRVSPNHEFTAGDRLRLVFEPSEDGYLYIFHQENEGASQMLFPDARLDGGNNAVRAHVPFEIPSSRAAEPNSNWFIFDERPARERLTIILARQRLDGVPVSDALRSVAGLQPWRPPDEVWTRLRSMATSAPLTWNGPSEGTAWTKTEVQAVQARSMLSADAPAPAVVVSAKDPNAPLGVVIELKHR